MNPNQDPDLARFQSQPPPNPVPTGPLAPAAAPQQPQPPVSPLQFAPPEPTALPQQSAALPPATSAFGAPQQPNAAFQPPQPTAPSQPPAPVFVMPRRSRRPLVLAVILVLVLLLLAAGFVFGYYLPNRPEKVYQTGLDRTGQALDKLVSDNVQPKKLAELESSDLSGSVTVTGPEKTYGGTFSTRYDKNQSDSTLGYKVTQGAASPTGDAFSMQLLTDLAKDKTYPDVYFKVTGLAGIGADGLLPGVAKYEAKWISLTSSYIESLVPTPTAAAPTTATDPAKTTTKPDDFTASDAAALSKIVTATTRQYVLTADQTKAVLVQKNFKGTEQLDNGVKANRYEVGINKAHAKDYCKALLTAVMAADAYKRLPNVPTDNIAKSRDAAIKSCQSSIDSELKDSDTFDMWIDTKTKLVHKVRFTDDTDKTAYAELGQNYSGGNSIPLFLNFHSDKQKYDVKVTLAVDTATNVTKGSATASYESGGKWKLQADFTFKPYKGDVKVTPPKDAIPFETVLNQLGGSTGLVGAGTAATGAETSTSGSITSKAQDAERTTDLKALQGQLEAYYAKNGTYPTLAELNSTTWRATNMKGMDSAVLIDPNSSGTPTLVTTATTASYSYQLKNTGYVLEAVLSTGKKITVTSLN